MNKQKSLVIAPAIFAIFIIGCLIGSTIAQSGAITITPESFSGDYSYLIETDGTYVWAKDGRTGQVVFGGANNAGAVNGTNASAVIQSAINALAKGVILVKKGEYSIKDIDISKSVHLCGESMFATKFVPAPGASYLFRVLAHNVILSDFEMDGLGGAAYGIRHFWGDSDRLYGLMIQNVYGHHFLDNPAVYLDNIYDIWLDKCWFTHGQNGLVHILDSADCRIEECTFFGYYTQPWLCYFEVCANLGLFHCLMDTSGTGTNKAVYFRAGTMNKIIGCHFIGNGIDVYLEDELYDEVALCHEESTDTYFVQEVGSSNNNIIAYNVLKSSKPIVRVGVNTLIKNNIGYVTENSGTATIPLEQTSVTVNHGLVGIPTTVTVTPRGDIGAVWVSARNATSFTITCGTAPGSDTIVDWYAEYKP